MMTTILPRQTAAVSYMRGNFRIMMRIIMTLFACCIMPGHAHGQSNDPNNAAYWYSRAMDAMNEARNIERDFEIADFDAYYAFVEGKTDQVPRVVQRYMKKLPKAFAYMHKAAKRDRVDFQLDYASGPNMMLPHLSQLRGVIRELDYDAEMRLRHGDVRNATRDMATILRFSQHVASDRVVISSLVAAAVFYTADGAMKIGFDQGHFDLIDVTTLHRAQKDMPDVDPFGYTQAVAMEQQMMVAWLRGLAEQEDGVEQLRAVMGWSTEQTNLDDAMTELEQVGFDVAVDQFDAVMTRLVDAFATEDRDKGQLKIDTISSEITTDQHGPLVEKLIMNFGQVFKQMRQAERAFATRRAMLEAIVKGQLAIADTRNAAMLYLKAAKQYEQLPEEYRLTIRQMHMSPEPVDPVQIHAAFEAAQPVIDTLRDATGLEKCDFEALNRWQSAMTLVPDYLHGLNKLWRLLHVQAMNAVRTGRSHDAAELLIMTVQMTAHMQHPGPMLRAMLAHHWFNQSIALAMQAIDVQRLSVEQQQAIAHAVEHISRADPFGYNAGAEHVERMTAGNLLWPIVRNAPDWEEHWSEYNPMIEHSYDAARTVYFAAIDHVLTQHGEIASFNEAGQTDRHDGAHDEVEQDHTSPAQPFAQLRELALAAAAPGMIDENAIVAILRDVDAFAADFALGRIIGLMQRPDPPQVITWDQWRKRARLDVRRAADHFPVKPTVDEQTTNADDTFRADV